MTYDVSIVVPTYNESGNVPNIIKAIEKTMGDISWEVIFVDDNSPDGTSGFAKKFAKEDSRVRCLRRVGRKGLSSACIEGILSSSSPYVAVMDADLQHDETLLPKMYKELIAGNNDLVIGSRYVDGGSTGELSDFRTKISQYACGFCEKFLHTGMSDPMSGFFMLRREIVEENAEKLYGKGFKILLDIVSSLKGKIKYLEMPYQMRAREVGESKLGATVIFEYLMLVFVKFFGNMIPAKFFMFGLVGLSGVFVYISSLGLLHRIMNIDFTVSTIPAVVIAMTSNFFLNNLITFRGHRLKGAAIIKGLVSFYIACSIGAIISIALSSLLNSYQIIWWFSAGVGIVAGSVWNYVVSSIFTWRSNINE